MVAYSYKKRFAPNIQRGLASAYADQSGLMPKRQTIRAYRERHARPGEEIQHYTAMRTKHCKLIGRARCTAVSEITIRFMPHGEFATITIARFNGPHETILSPKDLSSFAQRDGFRDWFEMREFWRENHGKRPNGARRGAKKRLPEEFRGVLIEWEPMS